MNFIVLQSLFAGELNLVNHPMTFGLKSDVEADTPSFTLTCTSMGGPVTSITWSKDGEHLRPENNAYSISTAVIDRETASYRSVLTVTGRRTGEYICQFDNNKPSSASAILMVGGECSILL